MKNNDDIHSTDTNEIKHLINRVKQGELDQGDALLIEKLLSILLTIVSLLERKHTSIQRMKELLFGMKEKKRGKDEDKNRAEDGRPGADGSPQTDCEPSVSRLDAANSRSNRPAEGLRFIWSHGGFSAKTARPSIMRLIILSRFTFPSTCPSPVKGVPSAEWRRP